MAEPLVLLPGLMCDARIFSEQFLALSGDRAVMVAPVTLGERIEQVASNLLDQMPHRFALVGHGLGGIVALEIYRRAPERVTRLCLISTDSLADTPQMAAAREPLIVAARSGRLEDALRQALPPDALAPGPQRAGFLDLVQDMGTGLGTEAFVRQMRAMQRRPDQQGTLRKISVPTLVLGGRHDVLAPEKRQMFMSELAPNARLCLIDDAGHLPTIEAPFEVTRALETWIESALMPA